MSIENLKTFGKCLSPATPHHRHRHRYHFGTLGFFATTVKEVACCLRKMTQLAVSPSVYGHKDFPFVCLALNLGVHH